LETGPVFRPKRQFPQSRITESQKAESPQSAGFPSILRQDYRVSVSNADCMAVVAVPTGIVSNKFPANGKSTGKNSNSRTLVATLPNITVHIHKDFHQNRHPEMKLTAKYQGIRINSDYAQLTDFRPVSPTLVTLCSLMVNA
jgi:hypothetical protein